jgi:hypothetical protein
MRADENTKAIQELLPQPGNKITQNSTQRNCIEGKFYILFFT